MSSSTDEKQRRKVNPAFDLRPTYAHQFIAKYIEPSIRSKTVIDIGCWTGQLEGIIQKYVTRLVAVDPNREAILFAQSHYPHVSFLTAAADRLPFPDHSFDVALLIDVLEHVPPNSEKRVLGEISRILKKRGKLILTTPNAHWLSIALDPAYFLLGHRHYSEQALTDLLSSAKLSVVSVKKYAGVAHLVKCLIDLFAKHVLRRKIDSYHRLKKYIDREFASGGFASLFVVAKKIS